MWGLVCFFLKLLLSSFCISDGCSEDTFMCSNGQCIPIYQVCDDVIQCKDASDEKDCGI